MEDGGAEIVDDEDSGPLAMDDGDQGLVDDGGPVQSIEDDDGGQGIVDDEDSGPLAMDDEDHGFMNDEGIVRPIEDDDGDQGIVGDAPQPTNEANGLHGLNERDSETEAAIANQQDEFIDVDEIMPNNDPIANDQTALQHRNCPFLGRDAFLLEKGVPDVNACNNDMFTQCSDDDHLVKLLLSKWDIGNYQVMFEEMHRLRDSHANDFGCVPRKKTIVEKLTLTIVCDQCGTKVSKTMLPQRLLAAMCGSRDEMWKMVLKAPGSSQTVFEVSHRCNVFQGQNVCLSKTHVLLETKRENIARAAHHAGRYGCFCIEPCIGTGVRRLEKTGHDTELEDEELEVPNVKKSRASSVSSVSSVATVLAVPSSPDLSEDDIAAYDAELQMPIASVASIAQVWVEDSQKFEAPSSTLEKELHAMVSWAASLTMEQRMKLILHNPISALSMKRDGSPRTGSCTRQALWGLLRWKSYHGYVYYRYGKWLPSKRAQTLHKIRPTLPLGWDKDHAEWKEL